jgi:hypothetical protein
MQDTVDPAAAPPRTPAQIIEDARGAVCAAFTASKEAIGGHSYPCGREAPRCGDRRPGEVGAAPGSTAVSA